MASLKPLVVLAAGGTGGHIFPASAFASAMIARGWRVGLLTDVRGLRFAESFPADWVNETQAATFAGVGALGRVRAVMTLGQGGLSALSLFHKDRPRLVVGFGGYPSIPALVAATALFIPKLIHEQNAVLGRVNRRFAPMAKLVASGFERLDHLPSGVRHVVTGNPVRPGIIEASNAAFPSIASGAPLRILITGGSQGATLFGEVVPAAIEQLDRGLRARIEVIQQARQDQVERLIARYHAAGVAADVRPFFTDMGRRLAAAHLVIGRAGASTVTEIALVGRAAILVPLGIAMDDHQTANAQALIGSGALTCLSEADFTPETLRAALAALLSDPAGLSRKAQAMGFIGQADAAERLADLAESVASPVPKRSSGSGNHVLPR
jgi:UDP-N-acetylglucosamine--N-acetylmuramyl-(pentapeptide) pyrophosphoryl-undecaprenol N-acetylglucosamine transferase